MQVVALPPGPMLAALAALFAALYWIVGRWRDLWALVLGVGLAALAIDRTVPTLVLLTAAGLLSIGGVIRSARAGVSRPALTAGVGAAAFPAFWLPGWAGVSPPQAALGAAAWCVCLGAGATLAALEGRVGVPRVRWIGRIPIETGPPKR